MEPRSGNDGTVELREPREPRENTEYESVPDFTLMMHQCVCFPCLVVYMVFNKISKKLFLQNN